MSTTCNTPGCGRLLAPASELAGALVPAETLAKLAGADLERAALVNRRIELERQGLCYICADQQAQGNPPVGEHLWREGACARCLARASVANNTTPCAWRPSCSAAARAQQLEQPTAPADAQLITLTVDVTDPAHTSYYASFPLDLRPAQLAAGRAALAATVKMVDTRLKEALHAPAPKEAAPVAQREAAEREEVVGAWEPAPGPLTRAAQEALAEARVLARRRHAPYAGPAHRAPDLHEQHQSLGRDVEIEAWEVPPPSKAAGLAAWFVRHPSAHPVWCWWLVAVVHLRPGEGLPSVKLGREDQTHELAIVPLSPEGDISPDHPGRAVFMSADQVLRLVGLTDAQAAAVCRAAVESIVKGQSPDSDFRALWRAWAEHAAAKARTEGAAS